MEAPCADTHRPRWLIVAMRIRTMGLASLNPSYEIPVKGKDANSHSSVVAMLFLLVIALEPNTMADVYFVRKTD